MITAQMAWHNSKEKQDRKTRMVGELEKIDVAVTEASIQGEWSLKYVSNLLAETLINLRQLGYEVTEVGQSEGRTIYEISWKNAKIDQYDDDEDK